MYSTISLADYRRKEAEAAAQSNKPAILFPPPEGPYSAYLFLLQNEENEETSSSCWGISKEVKLPFAQDKCLSIVYSDGDGQFYNKVYCIPVLGQPISSNRYYVVRAEREKKGLVATCSTEEDMVTNCFCCRCVSDVDPMPLQPNNPYQQIQFSRSKESGFTAKSVASDGFPPGFLRRDHWTVEAKDLRGKHGTIGHVRGMNTELRAQSPSFDSPKKSASGVVVGEWYCPFIFIRESGTALKDPKEQLMECPFYKMELHKFWENIYSAPYESGMGDGVVVRTTVRVEEALLFGEEATEEGIAKDGSVWFKGIISSQNRGQSVAVRLNWGIMAKIRADQGRDGAQGENRDVRVEKSFSGDIDSGVGRTFSCYVVVEKYVLKRMDGSIALTLSFRNCSHLQGKWQ